MVTKKGNLNKTQTDRQTQKDRHTFTDYQTQANSHTDKQTDTPGLVQVRVDYFFR